MTWCICMHNDVSYFTFFCRKSLVYQLIYITIGLYYSCLLHCVHYMSTVWIHCTSPGSGMCESVYHHAVVRLWCMALISTALRLTSHRTPLTIFTSHSLDYWIISLHRSQITLWIYTHHHYLFSSSKVWTLISFIYYIDSFTQRQRLLVCSYSFFLFVVIIVASA